MVNDIQAKLTFSERFVYAYTIIITTHMCMLQGRTVSHQQEVQQLHMQLIEACSPAPAKKSGRRKVSVLHILAMTGNANVCVIVLPLLI